VTKPITTKKMLQPFGGINAAVSQQRLKEEALRTRPRQECFDLGYITVKDLDDEELRFGRCRDESGRIPTKTGKTETIPKEQYDAMIAEHELRFKQKLRQNLDDMLDVMVDVAKDDTVEPRDRFEAAKYLFERVAGKTPETVNVNVKTAPWEDLLNQVTGIAAMTRAEHRAADHAGIVEAEWYDETSDGQAEAKLPEHNQDQPESTIRTPPATKPANMESDKVDDVNAQPAEEVVPGYPTQAGATGLPRPDSIQGRAQYGQRSDVAPGEAPGMDQRPPGYVANNDKQVPYTDADTYGHRKAERKDYAQQTRDAVELARRRKEARDARNTAKKQRKIARALGADAIKDEITGATIGDDGQVQFE
jgi:hypothetical protein